MIRGVAASALGTLAMDALLYRRYRHGGGNASFPGWPRAARSAAIDFLLDASEGVRVRPGKGPPHAQAVADILREAGADERTQVAGLLHDVVEDTPKDIDDVRAVFGNELAVVVDALSEDPTIER